MEKGRLVEFKHKGEPHLALADRPEGKKNWVLIDQQGQSYTIHPRQVIYEVPGGPYEPSELAGFVSEAEGYIDPDNLEIAWELLTELEESATPAALAQLLFSDQSPPLCYAAHRLLSEDKLYFKQKGDCYEPRPQAQIEELQLKNEREAAKQAEKAGFFDRAKSILAEAAVEWEKSDRPRLEIIERYALQGDESSQKAAAQEVLVALDQDKSPEAAFRLLVNLNIWDEHENLALHRRQIPTQFPEEIEAAVAQVMENPPEDLSSRADLTHLKVYTVDDESTREIDDGLSCETLADGRQKLWIHIADPTRWLTPGNVLDTEARKRCTTVYLPTGTIPMFPFALAAGPMSLVQGETCCALSFGILLSESGEVEEYSIQPSVIKPTYRLTYEDVDEMLELGIEAEQELMAIATQAKQRLVWRKAQGAIAIHLPESAIKVDNDTININMIEASTAREMVAEMMILTGEVAARYGEANQLPIPYRGQPQPELPPEEELMQLEAGWVRDSAIRRCMTRSEMGLTPVRHATLGLDRYSQVTSPIRRYTDLISHFQIKAHLRGADLPFSESEMSEMIMSAGNAAYDGVQVERQTKKYWAIEYLRRADAANPGQPWDVQMVRWLREHEKLGLIIFEDLGLEMVMRFDRNVAVGERLQVSVSYADPREEMIRFREVLTVVEGDAAEETAAEEEDSVSEVSAEREPVEEALLEEESIEEEIEQVSE
ncbi:MAG: RNB domain-containing ribonuclease [Leptolyngbya foveolarum]|uniref:RNB domain-containing ribonuclease n=1 Tax=Leptolyngbya foveolarum TaxID=47253 RepID=A0A2W4VKL7_9CYAN|nr:MAG: RNB domain-containing ribonuclease [Leptolyngbya foveolarum]